MKSTGSRNKLFIMKFTALVSALAIFTVAVIPSSVLGATTGAGVEKTSRGGYSR
jgi:hypothetical protein